MNQITFITGNQNKAYHLSRLIGMDVKHVKVDLDEIQSTNLQEIVERKVRQAYDIIKQPVLVEDVSLEFAALNGLPGPFIKFFIEQTGLEAICRMLDSLDERSAIAKCGYGIYDGSDFTYFEGSLEGKIAQHPVSGAHGFGWDDIFIPVGYNGVIRSNLSQTEYDETYLQVKPILQVKEFLLDN